mmetsp:Transcript_26533/g.85841  ORF Transcript_26533/g.85841 Transcript_26533/m.85841 type:complete len:122 (+) Transcript_26533:512-877(+)
MSTRLADMLSEFASTASAADDGMVELLGNFTWLVDAVRTSAAEPQEHDGGLPARQLFLEANFDEEERDDDFVEDDEMSVDDDGEMSALLSHEGNDGEHDEDDDDDGDGVLDDAELGAGSYF